MNWSIESPPNKNIPYDHTVWKVDEKNIFTIEWKSWKRDPSYSLMLNGEWLSENDSLQEAKDKALVHLMDRFEELYKILERTEKPDELQKRWFKIRDKILHSENFVLTINPDISKEQIEEFKEKWIEAIKIPVKSDNNNMIFAKIHEDDIKPKKEYEPMLKDGTGTIMGKVKEKDVKYILSVCYANSKFDEVNTFVLHKKIGIAEIILLTHKNRDKKVFQDEVDRVAKQYNAKILTVK